jgi:hypothetical protein
MSDPLSSFAPARAARSVMNSRRLMQPSRKIQDYAMQLKT